MAIGNELTGNETWNELPDLRYAPPPQSDPIVYEINSTAARLIKPPAGRDVIVERAPGFTGTIQDLTIYRGEDIRVIGIEAKHIEVKDVTGSIYFEGVHVDAPANADGIEIGPRYLPAEASIIFNRVRIEGISGSFNGVHADGIQIWSSPRPVNVFVDQSYIESNYQGVVFATLKAGSDITIGRSSVEAYKGIGPQAWQIEFANHESSDPSSVPSNTVFLDEVWANPNGYQSAPKWGQHVSPNRWQGGEWDPATKALTWPDLKGISGAAYSKLGELPDWAPETAVGVNHPRTGLPGSAFGGGSSSAPPPTGGGGNKITGTSGSDKLKGSAAADNIQGYAGNDRLDGLAGNDTLLGGTGNDTLVGLAGDDFMDGGDGFDRAWFNAPFRDFDITFVGTTGTFEYTGSDPRFDGTDTTVNIERFGFSDDSFSIGELMDMFGS